MPNLRDVVVAAGVPDCRIRPTKAVASAEQENHPMNRQELAQWLGERASTTLALGEIAEVLHVVIDASRRSLAFANADEVRELRFAVAVLRDVFSSDDALRAWLRAPHPALGGDTPADLLPTVVFAPLRSLRWTSGIGRVRAPIFSFRRSPPRIRSFVRQGRACWRAR